MEKETSQENPSLLASNNNNNNNSNNNIGISGNIKNESPRKQLGGGGGGGGSSDRLKRDEWSEGAVSSLLEAYENKWVLRNRAKLKGHDWEDVARYVSSRANCTKSPKTQTQCKNKIESMKKRYRSESATAEVSSWPLYSRLDLLLRGSSTPPATVASTAQQQTPQQLPQFPLPVSCHHPLILLEPSPAVPPPPQPPVAAPPPVVDTAQNSHGSNGVDKGAKEDGVDTKLSDHASDKNAMDTDSSTPAVFSDTEKLMTRKQKIRMDKKKKRKRDEWDIADSIRWLAEAVVRSEQAKMDTMRELEKMRIEAEAKRGEMDLKRTEIIANTQLEIAKIFAGVSKGVDSSLRIGRN